MGTATLPTHHSAQLGPRCSAWRQWAAKHRVFLAYVGFNLVCAAVLFVDPLVNRPNGLITTSLFTGRPADRGSTPCGFDYEGSWQIGSVNGSSPLDAVPASSPVLSCASVANATAASYVAEPFLVVPPAGVSNYSSSWFSFYQVKNLVSGYGEIGVAVSDDQGGSWQHLGTALKEEFSLSSPWVAWDEDTQQFIMIPDTHKAHDHAVQLYATSADQFPWGWSRLRTAIVGQHFLDTTAVQHKGFWWIFTTVKDWGQGRWWWGDQDNPNYSLKLYFAPNLTGEWQEHKMSPITTDLRYARGGGRPFVMNNTVYRWAQDDSDFFGELLHLFRATVLTPDMYMESYVHGIEPSSSGNWISARTHHIDIQQIGPDNTWVGLIDGDSHRDGLHHFYRHEARFVRLKNALLRFFLLQLALSLVAFVAWHSSERVAAVCGRVCSAMAHMLGMNDPKKGQTACARMRANFSWLTTTIAPELELAAMMTVATVAVLVVFALVPQLFYCPRWNVRVDVGQSPPVTHVDNRAPYNTSDLVVVTGATASFFDRVTNMIGSMHIWEPQQKVLVYDLGFSQSQLAKMMCWENVEVRRFPYEDYPPHIRDVRNYGFKTLVIQEGMKDASNVLWIDSGLELRAPMDRLRLMMSQNGHVSALQEDNIGDPMYTMTKPQVDWLGLGDKWDTVKNWQFCAGGLQGFVRGSDADRLVLQPVVNCSLHQDCIAPPGSSRKNHNFDQTALTVMIWANNFSCLPRETHCMWSVKKASRDPLQLSEPIEMISRGHRLPKPYSHYVRTRAGCVPDKAKVPWPAIGLEHQESLSRYNLTFKISRIWLQPIGDSAVQTLACISSHAAIQGLYWVQVAGVFAGFWGIRLRKSWKQSTARMVCHFVLGTLVWLLVQLTALYLMSTIH